jgi:hypothetical protein
VSQDHEAQRQQHATPDSLYYPKYDEQHYVWRYRAQQRAQHEEQDRTDEEPFGAEPIGCPAGYRDHGCKRQHVAGHRPGDDRLGGLELGGEGALCDRDDGAVQNRHHTGQPAHEDDAQQLGVELVGILTTARGRAPGGNEGHRDVGSCGTRFIHGVTEHAVEHIETVQQFCGFLPVFANWYAQTKSV